MTGKTKEDYYNELKNLAKENNITILSPHYISNNVKLLFRCNNKNCEKEWQDTRANIIRKKLGFKCPKCGGGINRYYTIEDMNEIAALKPGGGRCLSKEFNGTKKNHLWECYTCGNKWLAKPGDIIGKPSRPQGIWCPKCSRGINERMCRAFFEKIFNKEFPKENKLNWLKKKKLHLDGYNNELKLAFEYQGKQHYLQISLYHSKKKDFKAYKERDEYKRIMCLKHGIRLIEVGYLTRNGQLHKIGYEDMEEYIRKECEKKGIIVPKSIKKIDWRQFNVAPSKYLEEIKNIAVKKGGKCLSQFYLGAIEKLEFICGEKHHFWATPSQIKGKPSRPKGIWCPKCKFKNLPQNQLKYSKRDLNELAILRGGPGSECLSPKYLGFHKKHLWKCSKGHVFSARFDSVKGYKSKPQGSWCRKCVILNPLKKGY